MKVNFVAEVHSQGVTGPSKTELPVVCFPESFLQTSGRSRRRTEWDCHEAPTKNGQRDGRRDIYIQAPNEIRNHYDRVQAVDNFIHLKLDHKATDIGIS